MLFFRLSMKSPVDFPCPKNEDLACGTNCAGITWDFEVQQLTFGYSVASFFKDQGSLVGGSSQLGYVVNIQG